MGLICQFMNQVDIIKDPSRDFIFGSKMHKTNNIRLFSLALERQARGVQCMKHVQVYVSAQEGV